MSIIIDDFLEKQRKLLQMEHDADFEETQRILKENDSQTLEKLGLALNNLRIKSQKLGIYGKFLITLVSCNFPLKNSKKTAEKRENYALPAHKFSNTDMVSVFEAKAWFSGMNPVFSGLIFRVSDEKIVVSVEKRGNSKENEENLAGFLEKKRLSLVFSTNEVTFQRYLGVLDKIRRVFLDPTHFSHELCAKLLENREKIPEFKENLPETHKNSSESLGSSQSSLTFLDNSLNFSQKLAVSDALSSESPVFLIHGPPGTGKTKTLSELIAQLLRKKLKVLACGPSNISVDNLAERLTKLEGVKAVRIGNPIRVSPSLSRICLPYLLANGPHAKLLKEKRWEMRELLGKSSGSSLKFLRKELKELELLAIREVFSEADVVFATNTGADDKVFLRLPEKLAFDCVVIDEAAQALEISCWIPALRGKRLILAGDHKQLAPTIKSFSAGKAGLSLTLFDRIINKFQANSRLLRVQYRMNKQIMGWASKYVYNHALIASETVENITLRDFKGCESATLLFLDTSGAKMGESQGGEIKGGESQGKSLEKPEKLAKSKSSVENPASFSKFNRGEAELCLVLLEELREKGVSFSEIGVITPYNAQVEEIRGLLRRKHGDFLEKLEVSTVDGFQGREKEAIVISCVRSNPLKEIGFLSDFRRMNVAVTRAKRFVGIIADGETLKNDQFLSDLLEYCKNSGEYRLALEYRSQFPDFHWETGWISNENVGKCGKKQPKSKKKNKTKGNSKGNAKEEEKKAGNLELSQGNAGETGDYSEFVKEIEEKIAIFAKNPAQKELEFKDLNSFQRMKVHEIAEKHSLSHKSAGEGADRTLKLAKKRENLKEIIENLEEIVENPQKLKENREEVREKVVHKPSKKSQKQRNQQKLEETAEDEDEFLEKMIKLNKICNFYGENGVICGKNVQIMSICCKFCGKMFCLTHGLAETHGCGDEASNFARKKFLEEKLFANSQCKAGEKEVLKEKIQKKIEKLQGNRQVKAKKGKK